MGAWVVGYFGLALVYALFTLALIVGLARLAGGTIPMRFWALIACTLCFIFLTQHPFPDRTLMECPHPAGQSDLRIFGYLDTFQAILAKGQGFLGLMANKILMSMLMNFVICAVIGFLCAKAGIAYPIVVLLALGLTVLVEVAQLTGLFWLFPCAYREFSVDDMVLNVSGAMFGAALMKGLARIFQER